MHVTFQYNVISGLCNVARISNVTTKRDPVCPSTFKHNLSCSGHTVFNEPGTRRALIIKARNAMNSHSIPRSIYDLFTDHQGYLIWQDCSEGFAQLAQTTV